MCASAGPRRAAARLIRSVLHLRAILVVARLAGLAEVGEARFDRVQVPLLRGAANGLGGDVEIAGVGCEILWVLPNRRFRAGLADVWSRPRREQRSDTRSAVGNGLGRGAGGFET